MRMVEPRERSLYRLVKVRVFSRGAPGIDRRDAIGIARRHLRLAPHEIGRVQPVLAQFVEPPRSLGNRDRAGVLGRMLAGDVCVIPSARKGCLKYLCAYIVLPGFSHCLLCEGGPGSGESASQEAEHQVVLPRDDNEVFVGQYGIDRKPSEHATAGRIRESHDNGWVSLYSDIAFWGVVARAATMYC